MSDDQNTIAPVDDTRNDSSQQENQQPQRNANPKLGGSTGTGIAGGETGYAESGQLPDPAALPIAQQN